MGLALRYAVAAYVRARYFTWRCRTPAQVEAWQNIRLTRWLARSLPLVARYQECSAVLDTLPIVDKTIVMNSFDQFNRAGLSASEGWRAFEGDKTFGEYIVGASTGTSGNRGLFVISQAERFRWLGTILAKTVPGFWRQRHRVAIMLPLNTPLYDAANRMQNLTLRFFDLGNDTSIWAADLTGFNPTVIVAPPKVLRWIAEQRVAIAPRLLFSGAEKLDPLDRKVVEDHFGQSLGEIYMATEGLFAVSCAHGHLHLCEDTMHFELPVVGDDPDLREMIITDFSRDVQIMARYRMNDLVRLKPGICACGSPTRRIAEVVGRMDDCFHLMGQGGVMVTPDIIRNAIVDADRSITDYRVFQTSPTHIEIWLPNGTDADVQAKALRAMNTALSIKKAVVNVTVQTTELGRFDDGKLRRVQNRYRKPGP